MARKKSKAAPMTGAERMRLYRERRADSGQVNYAAQIPGSAARALDAKAEKLGLTRAEYLVSLSRGKAAPSPPPRATDGGGDTLRSNTRFRRVCEAIIQIRDKTRWRTGRDARPKGTLTKDTFDSIAADLRATLPAASRWDDIGDRL